MYRDLIRLRLNSNGNTFGLTGQRVNVYHVNQQDKMIAYHRWRRGGPGDGVIVVANMANRSYENYNIGFPRSGFWKVRFNSDWNGYDPDFNNFISNDTEAVRGRKDRMLFNANISIGNYSVIIFSQDK